MGPADVTDISGETIARNYALLCLVAANGDLGGCVARLFLLVPSVGCRPPPRKSLWVVSQFGRKRCGFFVAYGSSE